MITNKIFKSLAVLTPSRITNAQRHEFASASCASLRKCLKATPISHVVVHDSPVWKKIVPNPLHFLIDQLEWDERAKNVYASPELTWVDGDGTGSAAALLTAVNMALTMGKSYGFIHLDDHVYCERFGEILGYGMQAMFDQPNLLWTRFSGYPVIYNDKDPITPNGNDQVVFDDVTLLPIRFDDYTLWTSPLTGEVNNGRYWPVAMWFCIYRLPFLKTLLEWAVANKTKHLAHVEIYYKTGGGFQRLLDTFPDGAFGYINMQFGGIEMHRNKNWEELLAMQNGAIR